MLSNLTLAGRVRKLCPAICPRRPHEVDRDKNFVEGRSLSAKFRSRGSVRIMLQKPGEPAQKGTLRREISPGAGNRETTSAYP